MTESRRLKWELDKEKYNKTGEIMSQVDAILLLLFLD